MPLMVRMNPVNEAQFPDWYVLETLWIRAHFKDQVCVVFHIRDVARFVTVSKERFSKEERPELVNCEFAVLPCKDLEEAFSICRDTLEEEAYVTVWNHGTLVNENT